MWSEFLIRVNSQRQKHIARQLREWIEELETRNIIDGFAFNFYSSGPESLRIRFDCTDEPNLETVRDELQDQVRNFVPNYSTRNNERLWDNGNSPEQVYKAYELSSRFTFLIWKLEANNRFPEEFFSDFWIAENADAIRVREISYQFQYCFSHGIMNALGLSYRNEAYLHLKLLLQLLTQADNNQANNTFDNLGFEKTWKHNESHFLWVWG